MTPADFQGFHREAIPFFRGLARDNTKATWEAQRDVYDAHVRAPMEALTSALEGLYGPGHIYRPYRDVRFSKDKRPYKENVAVSFGGRGPGAVGGRHVHFDPEGLFVASGAYRMEKDVLAGFRRAVADRRAGSALEAIVDDVVGKGYELRGEQLKRVPREFPPDHPRASLLRRKGIAAVMQWPLEPWLFTPEAFDHIVRALADGEALVRWLREHVA